MTEDVKKDVDETLELMEETADVMDDTLDYIEGINHISPASLIVVGALGGLLGGVAAYFVCKRVLETKYEAIAKKEIEEAKEFYKRLNKKAGFENPEKALAELYKDNNPKDIVTGDKAARALQNYQGVENEEEPEEEPEEELEEALEEVDEEDEEEQGVSLYMQSQADENFDIDQEMKLRSPEYPYVISQEEFLQSEPDFEQTSITYYEGDDTLVDERDQPIPYVDPIVGGGNLSRFGDGSGDERVVYVRNEKLSTDFEVLKSDGKFSHEVLGLQHSEESSRDRQRNNRPNRFRDQDE